MACFSSDQIDKGPRVVRQPQVELEESENTEEVETQLSVSSTCYMLAQNSMPQLITHKCIVICIQLEILQGRPINLSEPCFKFKIGR